MPRNERRPQDRVGALPRVDLEEALGLAIEEGAVALRLLDRVRVDGHALRLGVLRIQTHVRDLGVGIGAPRDRERAGALAPEEERILDDDARGCVGGMRELEAGGNVAGGVDV